MYLSDWWNDNSIGKMAYKKITECEKVAQLLNLILSVPEILKMSELSYFSTLKTNFCIFTSLYSNKFINHFTHFPT
jgi:hypothetical protein